MQATHQIIKNLSIVVQHILKNKQRHRQRYDWFHTARPTQKIPPGDWRTWLIMAGRGFGKTRTGAETIRQWVMKEGYKRIALLADSETEGRDIMIEGPSGILAVHPESQRPLYEPSKRRLTWANGAIATLFSAENFNQMRGPQFDGAWIDELAKFRNDRAAWDQLNFGLRLGQRPRIVITTTPRCTPFMKKLIKDEGIDTYVTRGSTFENQDNLAIDFIKQLQKQYDGTVLGAQEIYGTIVENNLGALWTYQDIENSHIDIIPDLIRIVVAIDPAVTSGPQSDETGIIVAGIDNNNIGYILEDKTIMAPPHLWAHQAIQTYYDFQADCIVAEVNQGGDLVETMLRMIDHSVPFKGVYARRGKITRAEPVAALYKQNRIFHKRSHNLKILETQMCTYTQDQSKKSPDRLDALVWAVTELMINQDKQFINPGIWQ